MSKILLILDIDETLVFASEAELTERKADFYAGPFWVYRRPHLGAFLAKAAELFDLAIWSSASESYVQAIASEIFADRSLLQFVWSSDRCTRRYHPEFQEHFYAKNLKKVCKLGYPFLSTMGTTFEFHHLQAITELRDILPFLDRLSAFENVRKIEKRQWGQFVDQWERWVYLPTDIVNSAIHAIGGLDSPIL